MNDELDDLINKTSIFSRVGNKKLLDLHKFIIQNDKFFFSGHHLFHAFIKKGRKYFHFFSCFLFLIVEKFSFCVKVQKTFQIWDVARQQRDCFSSIISTIQVSNWQNILSFQPSLRCFSIINIYRHKFLSILIRWFLNLALCLQKQI